MQTRYKICILLLTITATLGAVTFVGSSNDTDAIVRFRELFSNHTVDDFKHAVTPLIDMTRLWYGGLSLFAILMIVLVFRAARRNGSESLGKPRVELKPATVSGTKLRPGAAAPAQEGVESVLRQELKRMADLLAVKDSAITELENNLSGKEQFLQDRNQELEALKGKMNALTEQLADLRLAKERAENFLQQELKKIRVLQSKDSVIAELENRLAATQEIVQNRGQELDAFRTKANALMEQLTDLRLAKERAESVLQRELTKIEILQAKEFGIVEQENENGLSGQIEALQSELAEKQELLRARNKELKAARSTAKALRERLNTLASTKDQMENVLQQQLKQKTELLQSKDAAIRELQETVDRRIRALEEQLKEENLLKDRDAQLATVGPEENSGFESASARERAKSLLLQELQHRAELLQVRDGLVKELQERLNATMQSLENARSEVERLKQQRDSELPEQSIAIGATGRKGLNNKLLELGAAKAQAAAFLQTEERTRASEGMNSTLREPEEVFGIQNEGNLLAAKDKAMESENVLSGGRKHEPKEPD